MDKTSMFHRSIIAKSHQIFIYFIKALRDFNTRSGHVILEIGTNKGGSSIFIAMLLKSLGKNFIIYTFDPNDPGSNFNELIKELDLQDVIQFHKGLSTKDTIKFLIEKKLMIDLLIIDGSHDPDDTIKDFFQHRQFLAIDSIVIIDDVRMQDNKWGAWKLINLLTMDNNITINMNRKDHIDGIAVIYGAELHDG